MVGSGATAFFERFRLRFDRVERLVVDDLQASSTYERGKREAEQFTPIAAHFVDQLR